MTVLSEAVKKALPGAIQSSIIRTAFMQEGTSFPEPDTRPEEVQKFEALLAEEGTGTPAFEALASKVYGHPISGDEKEYNLIKPKFLGVLNAIKPLTWNNDDGDENPDGVPFGTLLVCVKEKSDHRHGGSNWRNGNKLYEGFYPTTEFYAPATEADVKNAVEKLFKDRPAGTLGLYGVALDDVKGVPAAQE